MIESRGYEVDQYQPDTATPTERLDRLVHLRSINPLFGVYLADQLAIADPAERIAALESVLEVPGTVARLARMPSPWICNVACESSWGLDATMLPVPVSRPKR